VRVEAPGPVRFDQPFLVDIDGDLQLQDYSMTREPLLLEVTDAGTGRRTTSST
jgi:hypothetical protein